MPHQIQDSSEEQKKTQRDSTRKGKTELQLTPLGFEKMKTDKLNSAGNYHCINTIPQPVGTSNSKDFKSLCPELKKQPFSSLTRHQMDDSRSTNREENFPPHKIRATTDATGLLHLTRRKKTIRPTNLDKERQNHRPT